MLRLDYAFCYRTDTKRKRRYERDKEIGGKKGK
jgi:hypothetical protein